MSATISEYYRGLNRQLHETNPKFGSSGKKYTTHVSRLAEEMGNPRVLDYGCGKGLLAQSLPHIAFDEYDPAIEGKDAEPQPAELVACTDVLEHIEPDYLDAVLADLHRVTLKRGFFNICTRPAVKTLADGRNAHLIVEPEEWWRAKLEPLFDILDWEVVGEHVNAVVAPKTAA